jgi:magnesium transporter
MMVLKIFEKVIKNFQDHLKEINLRRNNLEHKLYVSNRNEELLQLMRIQKSLVYFLTALRSNELLMLKLVRTDFLQLNEEEKDFLDDLVVGDQPGARDGPYLHQYSQQYAGCIREYHQQ